MGKGPSKEWKDEPDAAAYEPKTVGYRVWMFGDSILDNSYWNGVKRLLMSSFLVERRYFALIVIAGTPLIILLHLTKGI